MKKTNSMKLGMQHKEEEQHHPEGEETFDDIQAAVFPSGVNKKAPFEEQVLSERMRNERVPVDYHDKKLELHFTSLSAYLQA